MTLIFTLSANGIFIKYKCHQKHINRTSGLHNHDILAIYMPGKRSTCYQGNRNFEIQIGPLDRWRHPTSYEHASNNPK